MAMNAMFKIRTHLVIMKSYTFAEVHVPKRKKAADIHHHNYDQLLHQILYFRFLYIDTTAKIDFLSILITNSTPNLQKIKHLNNKE